MKYVIVSMFTLLMWMPEAMRAQVIVKTGYISSSSYKDENGQETGGKGDLKFVEGSVNVPVSQKLNERKQPTVWIVSAGGGYTSMNNKNLQSYIDIDQTINLQLGVTNIRPVSKKWMLTTVGVGVYTASDIRMKNVLGQGGAVFIRQLKPNLSLGAGLAINNTFGYPMIFPAIYFDWSTEGRYEIKVSMMNAMEVSAGMHLNKYLKVSLMAEMNGALALVEREGKDVMFSQQYIIVGLQPELNLGSSLAITAIGGLSCSRIAYYTTRTLKAFFKDMSKDIDPYFKPAMYVSMGMKYKF